jgi:hypothetical protein
VLSWDDVKAQLKPFQVATTNAAFDGLWRDGTTSRFLVADEVGLGKTMVAKGVIARTIEKLRARGDERVDIVYICSNHAIARQNLRKLADFAKTKKGDIDDLTHADRLTMLVASGGLKSRGVNLVGLTPGTSFTFGSRSGKFEERAVLYTMLRRIWRGGRDVLESLAGMRFFYYGIGDDDLGDARGRLHDQFKMFAQHITPRARDLVGHLIKQRNQALRNEGKPTLYRRLRQLVPEYRRRRVPDGDVGEGRLEVLGECRQILAEAGVKMLQPDLVIMDEFQRFAELLDPASEERSALLLRTFLNSVHEANREPTKVLLLSATPCRWFDRSGQGSHHTDFVATLRFLHNGDNQAVDRVAGVLKKYRDALDVNNAGDAGEQAKNAGAELRSVMCRTERLASTADRNGMLEQQVVPVGLREADLRAYMAAQALSDRLKTPSVVELWKTSPWLPNLGDGYALTDELDAKCKTPPFAWEDQSFLDIQRVANFEDLDIPNPRLRWLVENTVNKEWSRLLWMPAAAPYYSVENRFSRLAAEGMTKQLVFSSWRIAPKAIALGVTYGSEASVQSATVRRVPGRDDGATTLDDGMEEWGASPYRTDRRAAQLDLTDADGQPRLTSFLLFAPLVGLAKLVDPLTLGGRGERSLEEVREEARRAIRARPGVHPRGDTSRVREANWYVAAARSFDSDDTWWQSVEAAAFAGKDERERGVDDCIKAFREVANVAGTEPGDLEDVLVNLALGSPAVCALRGMARALGVSCSEPCVIAAAARVAWAFRSYFNRPETISVIEDEVEDEGTPRQDAYWRRVLRYNVQGNLQAVIDEYFHMLREWKLGGQKGAKGASDLAAAAVEALSFRAVTLDVRIPSAAGGQERRKLRSRFAVRFGDRTGDTDGDRKDVTAAAFNSPFWPFVMATTSIGQEGLDFHLYSHAVVHWNLPPDPVSLEQREGRVHRYKGHAVRKNVAAVAKTRSVDAITDIWDAMFDEVTPKEGFDGIVPFWVFDGGLECPAKVQRIVPMLPMSRERGDLARLRAAATSYRLAFGQPRHDDLLEVLEGRTNLPTIDLTPRARTEES